MTMYNHEISLKHSLTQSLSLKHRPKQLTGYFSTKERLASPANNSQLLPSSWEEVL
jgi:hypothetical protein